MYASYKFRQKKSLHVDIRIFCFYLFLKLLKYSTIIEIFSYKKWKKDMHCTILVQKIDRQGIEFPRIPCQVVRVLENGNYELVCSAGILVTNTETRIW